MKKYIYPLAITATALFATACSDNEVDDIQNIPDSQKEMISFSLSDGTSQTRAGFTGSETSLAMRIQSDEKGGSGVKYTRTVATASVDGTNSAISYSTVTFQDSYKRYWDDAFGRKGQLSVYAVAVPNASSTLTNNGSTLEALLAKGDESTVWGSTATNTIAWQVTKDAQEKDASTVTSPTKNIDKEDLVYSNNIQADVTLGKDGCYKWNYTTNSYPTPTGAEGQHGDGRMVFTQADGAADSDPGHFDKGHLKFKHALSRITITLVAGEGFDGKPFAFASGTNISLLGMNVKGKLDVKTGLWEGVTTGEITKMAQTSTGTTAAGTYIAQMLPDYTFGKNATTNVAKFNIDGNDYYITQAMLFDALTYDADGDGVKDTGDGDLIDQKDSSGIKMLQGKNYKFTITVKKTGISAITATLAEWADVEGFYEMDNSHITVSTLKLEAGQGTACADFNLYRWGQVLSQIYTDDSYTANQYQGDYKTGGNATKTETASGSNIWNTNWFYEDNKTAYHFRTLNTLAANGTGSANSNITNTTGTPAVSSFSMVSGAENTQDYHWGAPMKTGADLKYSETDGFTNSLQKGIIAPKNNESNTVNITEFHMMSNIYVTLQTTTGGDKVNLTGATVRLTQLSLNATVDMGTGLITPNTYGDPEDWVSVYQQMTAPSDYWETTNFKTKPFSCASIPQKLVRATSAPVVSDYVGITINVNGNEYFVIKELSEITATSVTGGHNVVENDPIQSWYPGHKYYYTFTITKKGIENITCVLTEWVTVTAGNTNIDLES